MAFSSNSGGSGLMADINVTPLVDVMLVLLIIFMITAPLMSHKIKVELPKANPNQTAADKMVPIDLAIREDGSMYWNDNAISNAELKARLAVEAMKTPQPELQIRADKTIEYRTIWDVMSAAKGAGMVHVGFITTGDGK